MPWVCGLAKARVPEVVVLEPLDECAGNVGPTLIDDPSAARPVFQVRHTVPVPK